MESIWLIDGKFSKQKQNRLDKRGVWLLEFLETGHVYKSGKLPKSYQTMQLLLAIFYYFAKIWHFPNVFSMLCQFAFLTKL